MKNSIFNLSMYVILCALNAQLCAAQLVVEPAFIQFAHMNSGEKKSVDVTLSNTGSTAIEIISVRASCSCVTHRLDKKRIPPGSALTMPVSYDSTGKEPGTYSHKLFIRSADRERSVSIVTIYALVDEKTQGLILCDESLVFAKPGSDRKYIEIINTSDREYLIKKIVAAEGIDVYPLTDKIIPQYATVRIPVGIHAWVSDPDFIGTLALYTDDPSAPVLYCTVRIGTEK